MSFYDNYIRLCNLRGISPSKAAEMIGLDRSAPHRWKAKGQKPNYASSCKIAEFFNVDVTALIQNEPDEDAILDSELWTREERLLVHAWRRASIEERENVAYILRNTGFRYQSPVATLEAPKEKIG